MTDYDHEFETEEHDIAAEAPTTLADFLLARIAEDEAARVIKTPTAGYEPEEIAESARWLAECEAKRRIVERAGGVEFGYPSHHLAQGILHALALPYADHPYFREEWPL